jgi:hypothetical protein
LELIKPPYIDPAGDPRLSLRLVPPPFMFRNVTARVFPFKANMSVLKNFCDQYLNVDIPSEIVHYTPDLPFVYFMILNYGRMSAASTQAQNTAWVAQHEVAITVPLQRWRRENGRLVFKDWACVSPFIYVDDQFSLATGREVYGWNKVSGAIGSNVPLWITDPRANLRQFELTISDLDRAYAGDSDCSQTLLQIDLDPPPTFAEFPPDPGSAWSPFVAAPNAIRSAGSLLGSGLEMLFAPRSRGYPAYRSVGSLLAMAAKAGVELSTMLPNLAPPLGGGPASASVGTIPKAGFDAVTLKQFRNPEDPSLACYQALVNSRMGMERLNRCGLLGDINLLRGDSSGGYSVRLHRSDMQPIIPTLGLEVAPNDDGDVALLKPVLPFWFDVDLYYGVGRVICSRAHGASSDLAGAWTDEQDDRLPVKPLVHPVKSLPLYNTTLGAATLPITGPFHFPDVTLQVYPLLADRARLEAFLKNYLNDPLREMFAPGTQKKQKGWRFETFSSYVYMMVTVYGDEMGSMWSATNNIGGFFDREVNFCIPVKWYDENDQLVTVALIEPFTYSNDGRAVATDREVNGYNSVRATIDSPTDPWLTPSGPIGERSFLRLVTEVIPAMNVGQKVEQRTLLEIDERAALPADDTLDWNTVADTWGRTLIDDLKRKTRLAQLDQDEVTDAKALALEILTHGAPVNRIVVKQYLDSEDLDRACYQALVHVPCSITSIYDVREIDPGVHVRLHRCPGHLIVDALGLKVKCEESGGGEVVDTLQPVRPFWMRLGMKEDMGTVACYRAAAEPWRIVHPWFEPDPAPTHSEPSPTPPRRLSGEKPFFRQYGESRVGSWLASRVPESLLGVYSKQGLEKLEAGTLVAKKTRSDREAFAQLDLTADLTLNLTSHASDWLEQSLTNQLSWICFFVHHCLAAKDQDKVQKALMGVSGVPVVAAVIDQSRSPALIGAAAMRDFCASRSISDLLALANALGQVLARAGVAAPNPGAAGLTMATPTDPNAPDSSAGFLRDLAHTVKWLGKVHAQAGGPAARIWGSKALAAGAETKKMLEGGQAQIRALSEPIREVFARTFPDSARQILRELGAFDPPDLSDAVNKLSNEEGERQAGRISDKIFQTGQIARFVDKHLIQWTHPERWARLSYDRAALVIGQLDEVQLVVDNILSSEWENRGPTRWAYDYGGRKPDEYVPNGKDIERVAVEQGLQRWTDPETEEASQLWVMRDPNALAI